MELPLPSEALQLAWFTSLTNLGLNFVLPLGRRKIHCHVLILLFLSSMLQDSAVLPRATLVMYAVKFGCMVARNINSACCSSFLDIAITVLNSTT